MIGISDSCVDEEESKDIVFGTLVDGVAGLKESTVIIPIKTEQILGRISRLAILGLFIFYLIAVIFGTMMVGWIANPFFDDDKKNHDLGCGYVHCYQDG